jgi:MATE family multidrug resistance protein
VRVGNMIGRGDTAGMRRAIQASLLLGAAAMSVSAAAFTLLRFELPALYTRDARVVALAAQILPWAAAFQLSDGAQVVAGGLLRGMGRPGAAAIVNLVGYYVLALPLAYVLAFGSRLGLSGIWVALAVGLAVVASSLAVWLRRTARRPLAALALHAAR